MIIQTPFPAPLSAKVFDSFDNPVNGATVTFTAPSEGASANFSAPTVVTDASGQCSVMATANSVAGSFQVKATPAGLTSYTLFNLTNLTGSVGSVVFVQQPSDTPAGGVITPPVTVLVADAGSNPVVDVTVTLAVKAGALVRGGAPVESPVLGGTVAASTNASGVATFSDLSMTIAGTYHLDAVSSGIYVDSNPFQISIATSSTVIVAFEGDLQSAAVGTPYVDLSRLE